MAKKKPEVKEAPKKAEPKKAEVKKKSDNFIVSLGKRLGRSPTPYDLKYYRGRKRTL